MTDFEAWSEKDVIRILLTRGVVPLLGAGVNKSGRPAGFEWKYDPLRGESPPQYPPDGRELASYLATYFSAPPDLAKTEDLIRISQFIDSVKTSGRELYETLSAIFEAAQNPGPVHQFFARTAKLLRERERLQVILTTNYDDLLERALEAAGEQYDLITYIASGRQEYRGRFMHWAPGEPPKIIEGGNSYSLGPEKRTVIVKLHGAIQRGPSPEQRAEGAGAAPDEGSPFEAEVQRKDNFVITEDHYIEYLTHTDISSQLPYEVTNTLVNSSYLFLGYAMKDWNLRAILRRLWGEQEQRDVPSWAIQKEVDPFEKAFWDKRSVTIIPYDAEKYIELLHAELDTLTGPPAEPGPVVEASAAEPIPVPEALPAEPVPTADDGGSG